MKVLIFLMFQIFLYSTDFKQDVSFFHKVTLWNHNFFQKVNADQGQYSIIKVVLTTIVCILKFSTS